MPLLKNTWVNGETYAPADANAVATTANRIVTPEDFGAVGNGTTDDSAAITAMFDTYATAQGGACIFIPHNKTYLTDAFDLKSNTYVFGQGTLKCRTDLGGGGGPGAFAMFHGGIHNVTWIGPTLDINSKVNVNGYDIGVADNDTTSPFVEDIYIVGKVKGSRIQFSPLGSGPGATAGEDYLNTLYAGGGKGMALGFRVRNCYVNLRTFDCDIGASVESTDHNNHPVENVVCDIQAWDSHRTALFVSGGRDPAASSLDSGMFLDSIYPGARIRLTARRGQDATITHPVTNVVGTNYSNAGVVTFNCPSALSLDIDYAGSARCTLIRGKTTASTIRITDAVMDALEDVWDTRPCDTLSGGGTYMADSSLTANVHATTHTGVLIRPHRVGGTRGIVKARFDVNIWCQNNPGLPTQSDGTTDGFGPSVAYRFCDMHTDPIREVADISSHTVVPTWTTPLYFANPQVNSLTTATSVVATPRSTPNAAGITTLTVADSAVQKFTGTGNQTVKLPTTGVLSGQQYTIINNSTGVVFVQASNASAILSQFPNKAAVFVALIDTPVAPTDWQLSSYTISSVESTSTVAQRNSDGALVSWSFVATPESTTTSAGTLTLTTGNSGTQVFTGTTTHTVKLPTTSVVAGQMYTICNNSTQTVTVQSSNAAVITTVTTLTSKLFVAQIATPTTAANWRAI